MEFTTKSPTETEEVGKKLALYLLDGNQVPAFIALYGEMGVGKTAFVRGFCSAVNSYGVKSPTYTIVNEYRKGGRHEGAFPDRWLPAAICVLPEPWTEQNHFLNSSMKVVRGRVEEAYKDHMAYAYTPEGKEVINEMNLASL